MTANREAILALAGEPVATVVTVFMESGAKDSYAIQVTGKLNVDDGLYTADQVLAGCDNLEENYNAALNRICNFEDMVRELHQQLAAADQDYQIERGRTASLSDELRAANEQLAAAEARVAELEAQGVEPVYWESRFLDCANNPDGVWTDWERVVPRNKYTDTVEDRVAEFRYYIAKGYKYELRPLYLRAQQAVPEWQPIETAPKDGTRILLRGYGTTCVAGWGRIEEAETEGWCLVNNCWIAHHDATHWMPLPAAPSPTDLEGE